MLAFRICVEAKTAGEWAEKKNAIDFLVRIAGNPRYSETEIAAAKEALWKLADNQMQIPAKLRNNASTASLGKQGTKLTN